MEQPQSAKPQDESRITLTPDMRPLGLDAKPADAATAPSGAKTREIGRRRGNALPVTLAIAGLLVGTAGLGLAAWTQMEGQKEILRLSTELAELKVSLDLYARASGAGPDVSALSERLSALEQTARGASVPLPGLPASAPATTTASTDDCLPSGMRLLVAAGDTYPICDQPAEVAVSFVDNGYITLSDGTSVASGGTTPLPGHPACTIAVTSGGDEGLTGYAEIRVSC